MSMWLCGWYYIKNFYPSGWIDVNVEMPYTSGLEKYKFYLWYFYKIIFCFFLDKVRQGLWYMCTYSLHLMEWSIDIIYLLNIAYSQWYTGNCGNYINFPKYSCNIGCYIALDIHVMPDTQKVAYIHTSFYATFGIHIIPRVKYIFKHL